MDIGKPVVNYRSGLGNSDRMIYQKYISLQWQFPELLAQDLVDPQAGRDTAKDKKGQGFI